MPLPPYDKMTLPVLRFIAEKGVHKISEIEPLVVDYFSVSPDESAETLPSGTETRLHNRVSWAVYDLYKSGLLKRVKRGHYDITEHGQKELQSPPEQMDRTYLRKFDSFREWEEKSARKSKTSSPVNNTAETSGTPEDQMAEAFAAMQVALADELLEKVKEISPVGFEQLVLNLMIRMGYGGSREASGFLTKASGDNGIDGLINEDRLGLDVIYLQAKRYTENNISEPQIREFVGALAGKQANKGVYITTTAFSRQAIAFAERVQQKVILIDGEKLAELMIEHDLGVSTKTEYKIKRLDTDFFDF
ncbi:restriction endonuclease [Ruficoccus sp. ZRK36]|uniref:restriction endonuclease n=1 Tax=Ruficoccus sp. ZRK36 TaxID=2866311 RepID=UPI001C72B2CA|nr:restriction endonuclease [Ruficoccus sp. ZRK36]QYY36872.1 restriction endonuclease [Ruficoccus sp. ZRK36]